MKKRFGKTTPFLALSAIAVLLVIISGCLTSNNTGLSLTGTIKHDIYSGLGSYGGYSGSDNEYSLTATVTNKGNSKIVYDSVQIFFDGGDGEGLSTLRVVKDETKDSLIPIELGPLQSDELHSNTNGYTTNVLMHSKTGKVALHITFLYKGKPFDSFHAVLPTIIYRENEPPELPLWKETTLQFTRDYDAVMEEVQKN